MAGILGGGGGIPDDDVTELRAAAAAREADKGKEALLLQVKDRA